MSRPVLDTRYDIDGDPNDTQDALDGPSAGRRWLSRLLAFALAAASIYGAVRGFSRYSATSEEVGELSAITSAPQPKKLPTMDDLGGSIEPQTVVTNWSQQNTQRLAADKLHLWSAYGLMLLCPIGLVGSCVVWWRGQFMRPLGSATLDPTQLGVAMTCAVALAAVRGFDTYTMMSLDKMPPGMDLKTAFHQVRDAHKPERFKVLRDKIQQYAVVVKDKTKKPPVRLEAAKRLNAIVSRKEFADLCPEAEGKAIIASLKELIRANYADEAICPLLIKSVGATGVPGAVAEMASLTTDRQKSKATWVDVKSSAALQTLFIAVTNNDEASVKQLIGRGVSINLVVPGEGHTVLHEAVAMKNLKMARLLLDNRARTDVLGTYGTPRAQKEYPIHRAATVGDVQLVKLLLERGANPNVMDDGGYTPLHRAAALGDVAVAQVLLQGKASPNRLDKGGRTPIDVVEQVCTSDKKHAIRDLLERNGGLTATKAVAAQTTRTTPSPVASTPRD